MNIPPRPAMVAVSMKVGGTEHTGVTEVLTMLLMLGNQSMYQKFF